MEKRQSLQQVVLGVVRTVNAKEGLITIISTNDFKEETREVLANLSQNHGVKIEILEEGPWKGSLYINKKD